MNDIRDSIAVELAKPLDPKHVKSRSQGGSNVFYLEGWLALYEANRIFGWDGWTRETVEMRECRAPEQINGNWRVGFICKARITAHGVVRDGWGYGSGIAKDLGDAYESAIKEAETDAMKRALVTFGNPFGLALYDKTRANVGVDNEKPAPTQAAGRPLSQQAAATAPRQEINEETASAIVLAINARNSKAELDQYMDALRASPKPWAATDARVKVAAAKRYAELDTVPFEGAA